MGEDRKTFKIKDGNLGEVKIADEEFWLSIRLTFHRL